MEKKEKTQNASVDASGTLHVDCSVAGEVGFRAGARTLARLHAVDPDTFPLSPSLRAPYRVPEPDLRSDSDPSGSRAAPRTSDESTSGRRGAVRSAVGSLCATVTLFRASRNGVTGGYASMDQRSNRAPELDVDAIVSKAALSRLRVAEEHENERRAASSAPSLLFLGTGSAEPSKYRGSSGVLVKLPSVIDDDERPGTGIPGIPGIPGGRGRAARVAAAGTRCSIAARARRARLGGSWATTKAAASWTSFGSCSSRTTTRTTWRVFWACSRRARETRRPCRFSGRERDGALAETRRRDGRRRRTRSENGNLGNLGALGAIETRDRRRAREAGVVRAYHVVVRARCGLVRRAVLDPAETGPNDALSPGGTARVDRDRDRDRVRRSAAAAAAAAAHPLCASLGLSRLEAVPVEHCPEASAVILAGSGGFSLCYSGDCRPSRRLAAAARGVQVLVHEATFADDLRQHAERKRHSTVSEALRVSGDARAARPS